VRFNVFRLVLRSALVLGSVVKNLGRKLPILSVNDLETQLLPLWFMNITPLEWSQVEVCLLQMTAIKIN